MSRNQTPQLDSGVLAVLQQVGDGWRMLIITARNGRASVLETEEYPTGRIGEMEARLTAARAGRVICVLPAASAVCRTVTLPNAEPDQLQQALQLQAETHLPADAEPYRTAMTVLPSAPGETSRTGILLFWPPTTMVGAPPVAGRPITYAPAVTALVALVNGLRPADPVMWLDRADGSFALAISHANGAVFRAARATSSSSSGDWTRRITAALAETALNSGHTGAFVDSLVQTQAAVIESVEADSAALIAPPELIEAARSRLDGARSDPNWWRRYGLLAGAALAATSALAPLTNMLDAPAVEKPSVFARAGQALSQPRTAFMTAVICLLVLALTPLAASGLRLGLLKLRHPNIAERERAIEQKRRQLAMYSALEEHAWCASKLLSDVVCNTPEGIELEKIDLNRDKLTVTVRGLARPHGDLSAPEVIALMQEQLDHSGIFTRARPALDDPNAYGQYQFDLTADIVRPHRRQPYEPGGNLDFANWTLANRQRNEAPRLASDAPPVIEEPMRETEEVAVAPDPGEDLPDSATTGRSRDRSRTPTREGVLSPELDRGGDDLPPRLDIPPPLTEAQINAMTLDEVNARLTKVAEARQYTRKSDSDDEELKERLKTEFQLLMARKRQLQETG